MGKKNAKTNRRKLRRSRKGLLRGAVSRGPFHDYIKNDPFPPKKFIMMEYTTDVNLTSGSAIVGSTYSFNLNSLFKPSVASGATNVQPYAYGNLLAVAGPYNRYKVNGVRITVIGYDPSNDSANNLVIQVRNPADTTSTIVSKAIQTLEKEPQTVIKYIPNYGNETATISAYFPMHTLFGWTKSQFNNDVDTTTGGYNSSPGSIPIMEVGLVDQRSNAGTCQIKIKIEYYAMVYQRVAARSS